MIRSTALLFLTGITLSACADRQLAQQAIDALRPNGERVEVMPVMLNTDPPFRYPPALFASKVQGNVTLRIYIDSTGAVWPESTMVIRSSGYPALDSAAVTGSRRLKFRPARLRGTPVGVNALLPVLYRHPGSPPLPGDTILHGRGMTDRMRSGRPSPADSGQRALGTQAGRHPAQHTSHPSPDSP